MIRLPLLLFLLAALLVPLNAAAYTTPPDNVPIASVAPDEATLPADVYEVGPLIDSAVIANSGHFQFANPSPSRIDFAENVAVCFRSTSGCDVTWRDFSVRGGARVVTPMVAAHMRWPVAIHIPLRSIGAGASKGDGSRSRRWTSWGTPAIRVGRKTCCVLCSRVEPSGRASMQPEFSPRSAVDSAERRERGEAMARRSGHKSQRTHRIIVKCGREIVDVAMTPDPRLAQTTARRMLRREGQGCDVVIERGYERPMKNGQYFRFYKQGTVRLK